MIHRGLAKADIFFRNPAFSQDRPAVLVVPRDDVPLIQLINFYEFRKPIARLLPLALVGQPLGHLAVGRDAVKARPDQVVYAIEARHSRSAWRKRPAWRRPWRIAPRSRCPPRQCSRS